MSEDELIYVYPLPKGLVTNCPVCFEALYKDPFVNTRCGHHLCGPCNKRLKNCPECRCFLKATPDKSLERVLKSLQVYCSKRKEGCQWEGELGELQNHQDKDCIYVTVQCANCDHKGPRDQVVRHQEEECPHRMVSCQYCDYKCSWKVLTESHYHQCLLYPLICPHCNAAFQRIEKVAHMNKFCSKAKVACEASRYGCKWEGLREDVGKHIKDNWVEHFSLCLKQFQSTEEAIAESKEQVRQLRAEIGEKNKEIASLQHKISTLERIIGKGPVNGTIMQHISSVKSELMTDTRKNLELMSTEMKEFCTELIDEQLGSSEDESEEDDDDGSSQMIRSLLSDIAERKPVFTYELKRFHKHKHKNNSCLSPSFYANYYNMRLRVHPNGYGKGMDNFVSVYVCLVEGEYDDIVLWPFHGKVVIELEPNPNEQPHRKMINYTRDTPDDFSTVEKYSSKGNGCPKFLHNSKLPNYLYSNALIFHVYVCSS